MTIDDDAFESVSPAWSAVLAALARLPQGALSRFAGRLADAPIPRPLRRSVLTTFARSVGIDLSEVERPLEQYRSIGEFFVRRLRADARAWPADDRVIASPVDGVVGQLGRIAEGRALQAKGRDYSVAEMLADPEAAERFEGGEFLTIYLSPRHYHRIHTPVGGEIHAARHVPGALLPVNEAAVLHVDNLFATNERLITYVDSAALGRVAVAAVGAYNVGRISATYDPGWSGTPGSAVTNRRHAVAETRRYDPPKRIDVGGEIMVFHLGSTVVMLFERGRITLDAALVPGAEVRVGQPIAHA